MDLPLIDIRAFLIQFPRGVPVTFQFRAVFFHVVESKIAADSRGTRKFQEFDCVGTSALFATSHPRRKPTFATTAEQLYRRAKLVPVCHLAIVRRLCKINAIVHEDFRVQYV